MAPDFTDAEVQEAMDEMELDKMEDMEEDRQLGMIEGQAFQEGMGPAEPEERQNAHTFLHRGVFTEPSTLKTTFLSEGELGRPDFTTRFLLSIKTVAEDLIDPIAKELELTNGVSNYFGDKVENITASGLSNKGFSMNINVTRKMDARRERVKNLEPESNRRGRV